MDIKLYSPAAGNVKCRDTNDMNFTLAFDGDKKYIRGNIKVDDILLTMFMYEKCEENERNYYYVTEIIENNYAVLEGNGRRCFKDADAEPFHLNGTNYVMELQPSPNGFGCQVFMILPEYMRIEDVKLPEYTKVKLNSTFAGHNETFWWKSDNDSMLPDQISFDSSKNVKINILNSTPTFPYFFRIGSEQFIPTFNFSFGEKCKGTKFGIYLNLKPECQVYVQLGENGFAVSAKTTISKIEFKGSLSSMIFGGKYVSIKTVSSDSSLTIESLEICDLSNPHDVSLDQFVLRIIPFQNASNECEKAEILLLNSDVENHMEVLINRSKIIQTKKSTTKSLKNSTISLATNCWNYYRYYWSYILFSLPS
uniref:Uncharacterized protein n=1 Tax=Panagrolaimus davidi TaxID=227884 RepID=A0A914QI04_9BILA